MLHTGDWKKEQYSYGCGLARAFDYFINKTKGQWDIMCHIDSGDIIDHDHASNAVKFFYNYDNLGILVSSYKRIINSYFYQNLLALIYTYDEWNAFPTVSNIFSVCTPGANVCLNAKAIYDVGAWPNQQCEDSAISTLFMKKGYWNMWTSSFFSYELLPNTFKINKKRWSRITAGSLRMFKAGYYKNITNNQK